MTKWIKTVENKVEGFVIVSCFPWANQNQASVGLTLPKVLSKSLRNNAYLRWLNSAACLRFESELSDTNPKVAYPKVTKKGQLTEVSSVFLALLSTYLKS